MPEKWCARRGVIRHVKEDEICRVVVKEGWVVSASRRRREAISTLRFSSSRSKVDWMAARAARRVVAEVKARVGEARDVGAPCGGEGAAAGVSEGAA